MAYFNGDNTNTLKGVLLVVVLATFATCLAELAFFKQFAISPLIIGIVIGILYGNSLLYKFTNNWHTGILFSTKTLLRAGIVFYGFRLTFQNVVDVGFTGFLLSSVMVVSTFIFGYWFGTKVLKLDRAISILISAGSAICGAAAILATEPVIKAEPYKTSVAVATVVVFGTAAMFIYPLLYQQEFFALSDKAMGSYVGATLHEVAHVVGAGSSMNDDIADTAIIVKMLRVMLLAPFLLVLSIWGIGSFKKINQRQYNARDKQHAKSAITIPWFAFGFIIVVGFNSLNILSASWVHHINQLDNFLLTMAMTALGIETRVNKFKGIGFKPIYLASILFLYLMTIGYLLSYYLIAQ